MSLHLIRLAHLRLPATLDEVREGLSEAWEQGRTAGRLDEHAAYVAGVAVAEVSQNPYEDPR